MCEKLINYQQNEEFSRRCEYRCVPTHEERMPGNSLQNIDYSPNNRILGFHFILYLQFKKIPILLTVRNFFSKYTIKECQYHSVNLNNTRLQTGHTAVSLWWMMHILSWTSVTLCTVALNYETTDSSHLKWWVVMCVSIINCQVLQEKSLLFWLHN